MTETASLVLSVDSSQVRTAERELSNLEQQGKRTERATDMLSDTFARLAGPLSIGAVIAGIGEIIQASSESEKVLAQLDAAIKSTGGSAGFTSSQLQDLATVLQSRSTFDDEAILTLTTRMMEFGNVTGQVFERATADALDLATRLGVDLNSAALMLGAALNDPVEGLTRLSRAGVQFSDQEKDVIESLATSGRLMDAQSLILSELEKKFGGAAEAARGTFAGSISALHNAFQNLLESPDGLKATTKTLNDLTALMEDPATKAAAADTIGGMTMLVSGLTSALVGAVTEVHHLGEELRSQTWFKNSVDALAANWEKALPLPVQAMLYAKRELFGGNASDGVLIGSGTIQRGGGLQPFDVSSIMAKRRPNPTGSGSRSSGGSDGPQKHSMAFVNAEMSYNDLLMRDITSKSEAEYRASTQKHSTAYLHALMAENDQLMQEIKDKYGKASEFAIQAAHNTQDIIAQSLINGFEGGARGMARTFANMLRDLAAQAVAARLAEKLFGTAAGGGGGGGSGGWLGSLISFGSSLFAGHKDLGGSIGAGQFAIVGERGPEIVSGPATVTGRKDTAAMMAPQVNVRVIPVFHPDAVADALGTSAGMERVVVHHVLRNKRRLMS